MLGLCDSRDRSTDISTDISTDRSTTAGAAADANSPDAQAAATEPEPEPPGAAGAEVTASRWDCVASPTSSRMILPARRCPAFTSITSKPNSAATAYTAAVLPTPDGPTSSTVLQAVPEAEPRPGVPDPGSSPSQRPGPVPARVPSAPLSFPLSSLLK